jgi:hypothetical protein
MPRRQRETRTFERHPALELVERDVDTCVVQAAEGRLEPFAPDETGHVA